MVKTKVHFVCVGNSLRSILAEAYANSLGIKNVEFSSSGISPLLSEGELPKQTKYVAQQAGLQGWLTRGHVRTSGELLAKQDLVIFMNRDIMAGARALSSFDRRKCLFWDIDDNWQAQLKEHVSPKNVTANHKLVMGIFAKIKKHVDQLAKEASGPRWVGIVDEDNQPLGFSWPVGLATKHGLWSRGARVLLQTAEGKFVAEKRSSKIIFAPNLLDLTLGGYVDVHEEPLGAALRETREELGLKLSPRQLRLLQVSKGSHYHPKYRRTTKGFVYCYYAKLQPGQDQFKAQPSEVAEILFLSPHQARRLVQRHYLKGFGQLNYLYKLYAKNLELALN